MIGSFNAVAGTASGVALAALAIWSLVRDLKAGEVRGRVSNFRRESEPGKFWLAMAGTALAVALGLFLLGVGVRAL